MLRTVITLFSTLCLLTAVYAQNNAQFQVQAELINENLLPGEQTQLIIKVSGNQPDARPLIPNIKGVAINYFSTSTHISSQRQLGYQYNYRVTPVKEGLYVIPPITVRSGSHTAQTLPLSFTVHPTSKLISLSTGEKSSDIKVAWFPKKTSLYQNEQCQVSLRVYVPQSIRIVNWSFPEVTKVNCLAWRFSPPSKNTASQVQINQVNHLVVSYSTTLSGIAPGTAQFSSASLSLYQRIATFDPLLGSVISDAPLKLNLPSIDFDIKALPVGAPSDFNGAVGSFQIDAHCEKPAFSQKDPTEVILRVGGTGNLTTLKEPILTGNAWKIIDTSKITRGEERRFISGIVTFRQLIRSLEGRVPPSTIPPYSFSYFNPDTKSYHTLTTQPIPVTISPSLTQDTTPSETFNNQPEEMNNIISFIAQPSTQSSKLNSPYWHILPALLGLMIIFPLLRQKLNTARTPHPDTAVKNEALRQLAEDTDSRTFYRRAGRFIEQWLSINPELETVLQERNNLCFTAESDTPPTLPAERKNEIISLLTRCSKLSLLLILCFTFSPYAKGSDQDNSPATLWKTGQYQKVIDSYQADYSKPSETPADILYNIGNCHFRLNQLGAATLAWRRALHQEPTHQQARQNLRFVEKETSAVVPEYEPWQRYLPYFSSYSYTFFFQSSLWITGLIALFIITRRPHKKTLTTSIIALTIFPIIAILSQVAITHFPDDHRFAPVTEQAVVLQAAQLYDEAYRQIDYTTLNPASLVKINAIRGSWTNITTSHEFTGWVESNRLGKIVE